MNRRLPTVLAVALPLTLVMAVAGTAYAEGGSTTRDGKTLTVSKVTDLLVEGEKVRVRGTGYDRSKGIYVAFCVDNGQGQVPTPCGGGADTEGSSGNSVWISDLPPAYGTGLARPYGDGGSFDVEINVKAQLNEETDCRDVRCAVVTRNDHTRSEDRGQDVFVPIRFAAPTTARPAGPRPTSSGAVTRDGTGAAATAAPLTTATTRASTTPTPGGTASPIPSGNATPVTTEQPVALSGEGDMPAQVAASPTGGGEGSSRTAGWLGAVVSIGLATAAAWRWRRRLVPSLPVTDGA